MGGLGGEVPLEDGAAEGEGDFGAVCDELVEVGGGEVEDAGGGGGEAPDVAGSVEFDSMFWKQRREGNVPPSTERSHDTVCNADQVKDIAILRAEPHQMTRLQMPDKDKSVHFDPCIPAITVIHGIHLNLVQRQLPREMTLRDWLAAFKPDPASGKVGKGLGRDCIHDISTIAPDHDRVADQTRGEEGFPAFADCLQIEQVRDVEIGRDQRGQFQRQ